MTGRRSIVTAAVRRFPIRSWTGSSASLRVSLKADENRRRRAPETLEPIRAKLREQDYLTVSNSQQFTDRTRVS
ncbi:MAG: hypothetical protein OXI81_13495 [Paracoccaceae bacterium]|nr:hypothetical protein [Paracoccaceae bacterium]